MGRPKGSKNKVKTETKPVKRPVKKAQREPVKRTTSPSRARSQGGVDIGLLLAQQATVQTQILTRLENLEMIQRGHANTVQTMASSVDRVNDMFNHRLSVLESIQMNGANGVHHGHDAAIERPVEEKAKAPTGQASLHSLHPVHLTPEGVVTGESAPAQ